MTSVCYLCDLGQVTSKLQFPHLQNKINLVGPALNLFYVPEGTSLLHFIQGQGLF